jgi:hypothetical protein
MGWLILAVYALGFLFTARKVALYLIEEDASGERDSREHARKYRYEVKTGPLVSMGDRVMNLVMGCFAAMAWPAALAVWGVARSLRSPSERIEAERIRSEAERRELAALRKQAIQLGLPMPGDES